MTDHEIRTQLHLILDAHDAALTSIRRARGAMEDAHRAAFSAHDDALVSAIEANRAALRLLTRVLLNRDEGVEGAQP